MSDVQATGSNTTLHCHCGCTSFHWSKGQLECTQCGEHITVLGTPVGYQRLTDENGWVHVNEEDVPHYENKGQAIRPLYTLEI